MVVLIGVADPWQICLVKHVNNEVAHGDHVVPAAGRQEIELVQAREHYISTEYFDLFLVKMLASLFIYHASYKSKVNQTYGAPFKHICAVFDIFGIIWVMIRIFFFDMLIT